MKKRVLAITLIIATLCGCLCACGKKKKTPSSVHADEIYSSDSIVLWNDLYFYTGKDNHDEESYDTLRYVNLKDTSEGAFPVYSDVLSQDGDPFQDKNIQLLVDEEATAKNGGLPVLLLKTSKAVPIANEEGEREYYYEHTLMSFNTANNKMEIIVEDTGSTGANEFYLYKDTIYYPKYLDEEEFYENNEESDGNGGYVMYSIPKTGGTPTRYDLPEKEFSCLVFAAMDDKIYSYVSKLGRIYKSNPDFSNMELLTDSIPTNDFSAEVSFTQHFFYTTGYIYYEKYNIMKEKEGVEVSCTDLFRRPLNDLSDKAEEMILKDTIGIFEQGNGKIYYGTFAELQIIDSGDKKVQNQNAICRVLDVATGEDRVLFDFRNDKEKEGRIWGGFVCEKYFAFYISGHEKYSDWTLVELATGKESPFPNF